MSARRTRMQRLNDAICDAEAEAYWSSPEGQARRAEIEAQPYNLRDARIVARQRELVASGTEWSPAYRQAVTEVDAELAGESQGAP